MSTRAMTPWLQKLCRARQRELAGGVKGACLVASGGDPGHAGGKTAAWSKVLAPCARGVSARRSARASEGDTRNVAMVAELSLIHISEPTRLALI
eukprot:14161221-Alexandrium_andersonii.AAC.1